MLFSVNYKSIYKDKADEIRIPINQLGLMLPYTLSHPEKRYLIKISSQHTADSLLAPIRQIRNYTIAVSTYYQLNSLLSSDYKAFLDVPVTDWELFSNLKESNVTDIRIDGPLCFQSDKVATAKENALIRVNPTYSSNATFGNRPMQVNSFFIRPEDIPKYDKMVDILHLTDENQDREDACFSIYKKESYQYNLSHLIPTLDCSIPNAFLTEDFANYRLNCGQRCKEGLGQNCSICHTNVRITKNILKYLENKKFDHFIK